MLKKAFIHLYCFNSSCSGKYPFFQSFNSAFLKRLHGKLKFYGNTNQYENIYRNHTGNGHNFC